MAYIVCFRWLTIFVDANFFYSSHIFNWAEIHNLIIIVAFFFSFTSCDISQLSFIFCLWDSPFREWLLLTFPTSSILFFDSYNPRIVYITHVVCRSLNCDEWVLWGYQKCFYYSERWQSFILSLGFHFCLVKILKIMKIHISMWLLEWVWLWEYVSIDLAGGSSIRSDSIDLIWI